MDAPTRLCWSACEPCTGIIMSTLFMLSFENIHLLMRSSENTRISFRNWSYHTSRIKCLYNGLDFKWVRGGEMIGTDMMVSFRQLNTADYTKHWCTRFWFLEVRLPEYVFWVKTTLLCEKTHTMEDITPRIWSNFISVVFNIPMVYAFLLKHAGFISSFFRKVHRHNFVHFLWQLNEYVAPAFIVCWWQTCQSWKYAWLLPWIQN